MNYGDLMEASNLPAFNSSTPPTILSTKFAKNKDVENNDIHYTCSPDVNVLDFTKT